MRYSALNEVGCSRPPAFAVRVDASRSAIIQVLVDVFAEGEVVSGEITEQRPEILG
jgi:hypothetical protein